ncbi:arylsulfatase A-like enzyme [Neolewinella xylanilytica]|uniref:Arylsulfatase A-like enzyme n=1 Tax=Neolewinella xylanilytica TaxID=1514080 RepID=A0A2S6I3Y0_9BACT|nr:sulfatase-like hydrolase/transferase [Neolewinella xylanilytica]PPK85898.1 arylsulfatase A-like enzyme [Neolewinella xylanilytica]
MGIVLRHITVLACLAWATTVLAQTTDRPNIVFILADDLGYADLGSYGQTVIRTPNLDRLAEQGTRFTQVYAGSTVCAPSRSVLMTGQHTGHTTVRGNNGIGGVVGLGGAEGRIPLQASDTTVAELLQQSGYATGMIGKWGLGEPATEGLPAAQGFDYFFGFLNQRRAHTYFPEYVWRNNERVDFPDNVGHRKQDYIQDHFLAESLQFVDAHRKEPFFLYLPFTLPHDDYEIDTLGRFVDSLSWSPDERAYAAMVERLDRDVGLLLDRLEENDLADRTVVFFCSDNGAAQRWEGRFDSSGPLRGRKRDMYEGGLRTPMIVRYPGRVPAGTVSEVPWSFVDVLPTLSALAGINLPAGTDGTNVWPQIAGEDPGQPVTDRTFYWEFHEGGYQQAIRRGPYKAIRTAPDLDWELYNLEDDPGEANDLAVREPTVVRELANLAEAAHRPSAFFPVRSKGRRSKVLLIGDSTVNNGSDDGDLCGWGEVLSPYFDSSAVEVVNAARGGRSSKTYYKEGLWAEALAGLEEGDFLLIQFGHNDGGPIFAGKARGSLPGTGPEWQSGTDATTGRPDTVRTYGWYLRQYVRQAKAVGVTPVVCSMVPRNRWENGRTERTADSYAGWAKTVATEEGAFFIDLNERVAAVYDRVGEQELWNTYFKDDHTHTTCYGAELNARTVATALAELPVPGLTDLVRIPQVGDKR